MTRTPSTRTVLKTLRQAGFNMDAIIEQGRGRIEIGYLNSETGRVEWADRERTHQAAEVASELLGWGWYGTGYGTCWLEAGYRYDDSTRELIRNNMD
jgi:hypothetical protein